MKTRILRHCLLALLMPLWAGTAMADPSIIVNGVDVTGIRNQTLENVNVLIDAMGNVVINAPNYRMEVKQPVVTQPVVTQPVVTQPAVNQQPTAIKSSDIFGPMPSAPVKTVAVPAVSPKIDTLPDTPNPVYLVATFYEPGRLGYNVDVYINGQYVKQISQNSNQVSFDVTSYLRQGTNTLQYRLISSMSEYGYSSTATVDINLSKLQEKKGDAVMLSGQYASVHIRGSEATKPYDVTFNVPRSL